MVGGVAPRRALKFLSGDFPEILVKIGRIDHLLYWCRVLGDGSANSLQICRGGHVHAARQKRSAGHDVDVVGQPQRVPAAGSEHG